MGRIVYIVGTGVGMTVERFCQVHANDIFLVELVKQVPEQVLEGKTLTLHNCSVAPYDILTVPENFNHHYHEKINSLPYHRRTRRSDISSKQLRAKPLQTTKYRYSRKGR